MDDPNPELARLSLPRAIYATVIKSQVDVQAAQIAFNAVFSLGPLMALTMTLLSALPYEELGRRFREIIVPYAPEAVRPFLEAQLRAVTRTPNTLLIALSLGGLLWTISSSTSAISTALGHVGWKLVPGWARQRLRAAVLGVVAALGLVLSAIAASVGPVVLRLLSHITRIPLEGISSVAWVRWPVAGIVFALASALFVSFGTAQRPRPMAILWGGGTAGVISVVASWLLAVYLSRAPRMGGAYGAAGAVFAALLWLYVLALGLLLGSIVAYVLHARGPHFGAIITGAKHVGTHALGHTDGRTGGTSRLLRRRSTRPSASRTRSRIGRERSAGRGAG